MEYEKNTWLSFEEDAQRNYGGKQKKGVTGFSEAAQVPCWRLGAGERGKAFC